MDGWNTSFFLGSGLCSGPTKQHEPVKYSLVVMPLRISDHFSCPEIYQVCLCYAFQWYHSTCFSPPHCSKKEETCATPPQAVPPPVRPSNAFGALHRDLWSQAKVIMVPPTQCHPLRK